MENYELLFLIVKVNNVLSSKLYFLINNVLSIFATRSVPRLRT